MLVGATYTVVESTLSCVDPSGDLQNKLYYLFSHLLRPNFLLFERTNAHGRDLKGWNPAAIAVFHDSKAVLELLLQHGADPHLKSSYNKSAWDQAQDDLDAAGRVVRSRCNTKVLLFADRFSVNIDKACSAQNSETRELYLPSTPLRPGLTRLSGTRT